MSFYLYILINTRDDDYVKPGVTAHPKYRIRVYKTSNPYYKFAHLIRVNCSKETLFKIESAVLRATKDFHPDPVCYPNNECRFGIPPDDVLKHIGRACNEYKVENAIISGDECISAEIAKDKFHYVSEPDDERDLTNHQHFRESYDLDKPCDTPQLRSFQVDAFQAIEKAYDSAKTGINLIMPCGTGKTVVFQEFAFKYREDFRHIVYVTSALKLIENMVARWFDLFKHHEIIEISSSGSNLAMDDHYIKHLIEQQSKIIFFVCDQSFAARAVPNIFSHEYKTLIIWDEAHKLCNDAKNNPLVAMYNMMNDKSASVFNIFSTATPIYGNPKTAICMNDYRYFAECEYRYCDLDACIREKFICDMRLVVKRDPKRLFYNRNRIEMSNAINTLCSLLSDDTLAYRPRKVIVYCARITEVDEYYNAFSTLIASGIGGLSGFSLYKLYTDGENMEKSLVDFEQDTGKSIMININMLNDGINVPDIDTVLFTSAIQSKPNIIQRIFRARRYVPSLSDKMAYLVIPVTRANIDDQNYDMVIRVLLELIELNDPSFTKFLEVKPEKHSGILTGKPHKHKQYDPNDVFCMIDDEVKHEIITNINGLMKCTGLDSAICRALQSYPMEVIQIVNYINKMGMLGYIVDFEKCQNTCYYLEACGKLISNTIKDVKTYFYCEKYAADKDRAELDRFLEKLRKANIYYETEYYGYAIRSKYEDLPVNPIDEFAKFKFKWSDIAPREDEKFYNFDQCKEAIEHLLSDSEKYKQVTSVIGAGNRLNKIREYDRSIPTVEFVTEKYKPKKISDLHKVFKVYLY